MFKGLFLTGSMLGMLGDFAQEKSVNIPDLDEAITLYGNQSRISLQFVGKFTRKNFDCGK
jgi:hypothetical protein